MHAKVTALQVLAEIDLAVITATEPQAMLDLICRRAAELVAAPKSAIIIEVSPGKMEMAASHGLLAPAQARDEFARLWQAGTVHLGAVSMCEASEQASISAVELPMPEFSVRENICTHILAPLGKGEQMLGAIEVFGTAPHIWSADDFQILSLLAGQATLALDRMRLFASDSKYSHQSIDGNGNAQRQA